MNEPTELQIILGGVHVEAKMRDGKTEEVKVRQLPTRLLLGKWTTLQGDEAGLVELYCDKPENWDDELLPESHDEIVQIGDTLNRPRFAAWTDSRQAAVSSFKTAEAKLKSLLPSDTSSTPAASSSGEPTPK